MGSEHRQLIIIDQLKLNSQNNNWCTECTYNITNTATLLGIKLKHE